MGARPPFLPRVHQGSNLELRCVWRRAEGVAHIEGSLSFRPDLSGEVLLPALTSVSGEVHAEKTQLAALSMPALARVGLLDVRDNPQLTRVELPALAKVEPDAPGKFGSFAFIDNPQLHEVNAPLLRIVIGDLGLAGTSAILPVLSLPRLARILGKLSIRLREALEVVDLSSLREAEHIETFGVFRGQFSLPALRAAGTLQLDASAVSVSLPALEQVGTLSLKFELRSRSQTGIRP